MPRKTYTPDQIISKLREAKLLIHKGHTAGEAIRKIGVSEYTYYRWRREYGGMGVEQARRLKKLEKENRKLKQLVADLSLDKQMLQDVLRKSPEACSSAGTRLGA